MHFYANIFRYFVAGELFFAIGYTSARLIHASLWTKDRSRFFIGLSLLFYAAGGIGLILKRIGQPLSGYSILLCVAATLLIVAQIIQHRQERDSEKN